MENERAVHPTFLLRLPCTMRKEVTRIARDEGISLNHFITLALAEKLSRLEHKSFSTPVSERFGPMSQASFIQTSDRDRTAA